MNVLITGGCGLIGSAVAERFHKEGHRVYIIDDLSSGSMKPSNSAFKFYKLSVEDPACEEVFRGAGFEVVVHLASRDPLTSEKVLEYEDTRTNMMGLIHMLDCSQKHGVRKFIYGSSSEVYGHAEELPSREDDECIPHTVHGVNVLVGEQYCKKWHELYGLQTVSLRIANVYGPGMQLERHGVIGKLLEQGLNGQPLTLFGDGEQARDFIYVADVADLIYRASQQPVVGVINASTNVDTSINALLRLIRLYVGITGVDHHAELPTGPARVLLDNTKAKQLLDWVPLYTLQEGIQRTYEWLAKEKEMAKPVKARRRQWPDWARLVRPYVENLLAFALLYLLTTNGLGWSDTKTVDFNLLYVLVIGIFYGTKQSLPASIAVIVLQVGEQLVAGRHWSSLLGDSDMLLITSVYLFFGLAVGFYSDKVRKEKYFAANDLQLEKQRYSFLMEVYKDTRDVKDRLQKQVLTSKDSLGRLHSIVAELESMEPEQVVFTSVTVLEDLLETRRISIYAVNENSPYLRLMSKSSDPDFRVPRSLYLNDAPEIAEVIRSGRHFSNKSLSPDAPMLVAPVLHERSTVAIICIHEQSFEKFSLYYENLFRIASDLVSRSLSRSFTYVTATRSDRYVEGTEVLQEKVYTELLQSKQAAKERNQTDFVMLLVKSDEDITEVSRRLFKLLRTTDYMGLLQGRLTLMLSNTSLEEAGAAITRLEKNGFVIELLEEGLVHG
ncbi:NAD-dependent epimerase/dehydratase family protein [Paenibacillus sp. YYML68]|uniref:NAD-dependent epimerase/dehydratase family protein n=1 Tax=Paenibacillus sp. YYML68 TaxID=2909250 RepID=UPI0024917A5B|nr:NAD-dependent epimerase/dehydratase family protein [Paenibacillus sp. YYML68]